MSKPDYMGMDNIEPFNQTDDLPERIDHDALEIYNSERFIACPECAEPWYGHDPDGTGTDDQDYGKWCRICGYMSIDPAWKVTDGETRARARFESLRAEHEAKRHLCYDCEENFGTVECDYPMYSDFDGKLLGHETLRYCVPCYLDIHDDEGIHVLYDVAPSRVEFV